FGWEGRIHEILVNNGQHRSHRTEDVVVHHRPDPGRIPAKLRRNIDLLTAQQAEEGETSPRTLFYLANEYASSGDNRTALDFFRRYMKVAVWDDERYIVQTRIAEIYRSFGNYRQAVDADLRALKICPHWPDAYFGLAESYYYLNDWHKVIHWSEMGRAMPTPETTHIINPMKYAFHWIIYYTNALYRIGEVREALEWTKRALEICPQGPWHSENFLMFSEALQGTAGIVVTSESESTRNGDTAEGSPEYLEGPDEPECLAR